MRKTKFCVPTTFEDSFLDSLNELNRKYRDAGSQVCEVYGSFKTSLLGTGWPSTVLPFVDEETLAQHIEKAHSYDIEFAYTLNAVCMNLAEYTEEGHGILDETLRKLSQMKADTLIITIPYIIEYVAKNYPEFKIKASSLCYIDSLNRARMFEKLGAHRITLSEDLNRCFSLLKLIRNSVKTELEVIANNGCLHKCPFRTYHNTITAHTSQSILEDHVGFTYRPYPLIRCTLERLSNHKEIIRSPWFRPEDVKYYTEIGIDYIKIAGRGLPADVLLKLIEAYLSSHWEGDIYALIDNSYMQFCLDMFDVNSEPLPPLKVSIDNRSLDGWYEYFAKNNPPCLTGCENCNYCDELAKKVVKVDYTIENKYIERIRHMISKLTSRKLPVKLKRVEGGGQIVIRDDGDNFL